MDNKILIEVYVPMIEKQFDVFIPINKKIKNVATLLYNAVSDLANGALPDFDNVRLYNRFTGLLLESKLNLTEAGLVNGSQVVLVMLKKQ